MESRKVVGHYTRFTVHQAGKEFPNTLENLKQEDPKTAYQQLGIYYAFNERNQALAEKYLDLYLARAENVLEKAEALMYLAYSKTIDPTFRETQLFEEVWSLVCEIDNTEARIIEAFALQYKALMMHRQAIAAKSAFLDTALFLANEAIASQRRLSKKFPLVKIGLAEALHLKAIMFTRLGDAKMDPQYFCEADALFVEAAQLEKEFCEETNAPHFLTAITMQSHAMILMKLQRYDEAFVKLKKAYKDQVKLFKTCVHPDIAKTLHFLGEVELASGKGRSAVDYFLAALMCKKQIMYKDNYMVSVTEKKLVEALTLMKNSNNGIDQLLYAYNIVYTALTGKLKEKFIEKEETFANEIRQRTEALQNIIYYRIDPIKEQVHPDIADGLYFRGEMEMARSEYGFAVDAFLDSLVCQKQIPYPDNSIISLTEKKLIEALDAMKNAPYGTDFLYTKHKQIYKTLTGELKEKFLDKDEEFAIEIKKEMERLRDIISRNASREYGKGKSKEYVEPQEFHYGIPEPRHHRFS